MSTTYKPVNRRIIPRWRDSVVAATTGELKPLKLPETNHAPSPDELAPRINDWRENRSIAFASDLISVGFVLDVMDTPEIQDAAQYILSLGHDVPVPAQELAKEVTSGSENNSKDDIDEHAEDIDIVEQSRKYIRIMKARLNGYPG